MTNARSTKRTAAVSSIVVDASAAIELLLQRVAAPAVADVVDRSALLAPATLDGEVLSVIRRLWLRGDVTERRASDALDDLAQMPVERVPVAPLLGTAWSLRSSVSAPDALYVALARALDCPLVTLDRRLAGAPGLGITVVVPSR